MVLKFMVMNPTGSNPEKHSPEKPNFFGKLCGRKILAKYLFLKLFSGMIRYNFGMIYLTYFLAEYVRIHQTRNYEGTLPK